MIGAFEDSERTVEELKDFFFFFKTISLDNCRGLKLIFCMPFTQPSP
jgi:hypothetical protein